MISIIDKKDCSGCGACANICPHECISMSYDEEGFLYPIINTEKCIDCHLCEKICPIYKHPLIARKPLEIRAAINENETIRLQSSSGGIFLY